MSAPIIAPKRAAFLDEAEVDLLAYMSLRRRIAQSCTPPLRSRLNGKIKRRTEVVGLFPNDDAIVRLVAMERTRPSLESV